MRSLTRRWVKQGTSGVGGVGGGNTADVEGKDVDVDGGAIVTTGGLLVVDTVATEGKAEDGGGITGQAQDCRRARAQESSHVLGTPCP